MVNLKELNASHNQLNDMKEMSIVLKCWPKLINLELSGNPLCAKNKYRERIILLSSSIQILDGKEITELSRQFLENWKLSKETSQKQQQQQRKDKDGSSSVKFNDFQMSGKCLN
jgi:protein phosphatase 1 regulatory subunit 42